MKIAGKNINNWWLIGGGAGVAVLVFYYRKHSASSSSGSQSPTSIDPVTGLPYSEDQQIDPATGLTYLAEAEQYGSVAAAEQMVASGGGSYLASGGSGYTSGYPTYTPGTYYTGAGGGNPPGSYATNAQWAQAATAGLVALGYNAQDVAAALGLYFQSHPLGTAPDGASYLSIVQAAVAEFGPPPQGTYQIIPSSGSQPPIGGPPPWAAPTGLHSSNYPNFADLAWSSPAGNSATYHVSVWNYSSHAIAADTTVTGGHFRVSGLTPNTAYAWHVAVEADSTHSASPYSSIATFKTS